MSLLTPPLWHTWILLILTLPVAITLTAPLAITLTVALPMTLPLGPQQKRQQHKTLLRHPYAWYIYHTLPRCTPPIPTCRVLSAPIRTSIRVEIEKSVLH